MLEKYLAFNKNFMKIKKFGKIRIWQSISGRKKTILTLIFLSLIFLLSGSFVLAAACGYTCYPSVCPQGSSGISGDCQSGYTCCAGTPTNYGGTTQNTFQSPTTGGATFTNPLGSSDTIEKVLTSIWTYLQGIAGTIAVIFIIIGGVMYMVSGGSKDATERAKKTVIFAIIGLAIVLAAPFFYQEIKALLLGGSPGTKLQEFLLNVLKLLLSIVGFLAIISMVIGAIWMFTAVGDDERYELGKKTATYSIIGLVIALSALMIAQQVINLIGNSGASLP
jgi:type IV secretory pathway VirB2 component (pilin)